MKNQKIYPKALEYDPGGQLFESLSVFEDAPDEKKLKLETDIPDHIAVAADADSLATVWNNQLSNAIQFTDPGWRITVRLQKKAGKGRRFTPIRIPAQN